jgi:hypothetical protein
MVHVTEHVPDYQNYIYATDNNNQCAMEHIS